MNVAPGSAATQQQHPPAAVAKQVLLSPAIGRVDAAVLSVGQLGEPDRDLVFPDGRYRVVLDPVPLGYTILVTDEGSSLMADVLEASCRNGGFEETRRSILLFVAWRHLYADGDPPKAPDGWTPDR